MAFTEEDLTVTFSDYNDPEIEGLGVLLNDTPYTLVFKGEQTWNGDTVNIWSNVEWSDGLVFDEEIDVAVAYYDFPDGAVNNYGAEVHAALVVNATSNDYPDSYGETLFSDTDTEQYATEFTNEGEWGGTAAVSQGEEEEEDTGLSWIQDRPETYDPTLVWDPDEQDWVTPTEVELKHILVAVGHDINGLGTIYFSEV